eukprot:COSAG03_NODE_7799_length_872_cov_0.842173_1_plen_62_part_10
MRRMQVPAAIHSMSSLEGSCAPWSRDAVAVWMAADRIHDFFKQKTAYVIRIRDWSSDVCSSD